MKIITKILDSPLLKGALITTFSSGFSKLLLILVTFFCTHHLCKEDFGFFSFTTNTLNVLLGLCALNFSGLCTKFTAESSQKESSHCRLIILLLFSLLICLLVSILLFTLPSEWILRIFPSNRMLKYIYIIGALLPIFMIQPLVEGILRGYKLFRMIGYLQISTSVLYLILIFIGIYFKGVSGAIFALIIYYVVYSFLSIWILSKIKKIKDFFTISKECIINELPVLKKIIFPVFFMSFIDVPINWWAQAILAKYGSFSAIGSMVAILQLRNFVILVPTYYFMSLLPFVSTLNAEKKMKEYFQKFNLSAKYFVVFGVIITLVLILLHDFFLGLYGELYKRDFIPYVIAMLGYPFFLITYLYRINSLVKEHQRSMLIITLISNLFFIISLYAMLLNDLEPLSSYFTSQLFQIIIMGGGYFLIFNIDKKTIENENTRKISFENKR